MRGASCPHGLGVSKQGRRCKGGLHWATGESLAVMVELRSQFSATARGPGRAAQPGAKPERGMFAAAAAVSVGDALQGRSSGA